MFLTQEVSCLPECTGSTRLVLHSLMIAYDFKDLFAFHIEPG